MYDQQALAAGDQKYLGNLLIKIRETAINSTEARQFLGSSVNWHSESDKQCVLACVNGYPTSRIRCLTDLRTTDALISWLQR